MQPNHVQLWDRCRDIIRDNIPAPQYDTWFKDVTALSYDNGKLTLSVPSEFFVEQLEGPFLRILASALHRVFGDGVQLYYNFNQVNNDPETKVSIKSARPSGAAEPIGAVKPDPFQSKAANTDVLPQLNPRFCFENYCVSASNKLPFSIGEAIGNNPKQKTFNPLFVFGPTGVGKTHLIQAIGLRIKETMPEARVLYLTARLFESQYTYALCHDLINDFFAFYQSIDVLIVDDVQDLAGKPGTQSTFYHIFNHLHLNQKHIIMSSDTAPAQMHGLEARLLGRFKCGMATKLEKPDFELRKQVLIQKAEQDGLVIPADVIDLIAHNVTESIRDLEGVITSLIAHATVLNREITVDLARTVIGNAVRMQRKAISFDTITQAVAQHYAIDPESIFTATRKREISDARQMVMFLAKKDANMSLKAIGARLDRTHATVIYACRNIEERLQWEKKLQEDLAAIRAKL